MYGLYVQVPGTSTSLYGTEYDSEDRKSVASVTLVRRCYMYCGWSDVRCLPPLYRDAILKQFSGCNFVPCVIIRLLESSHTLQPRRNTARTTEPRVLV